MRAAVALAGLALLAGAVDAYVVDGDAGGNTFIFLAKFAFGYDPSGKAVGTVEANVQTSGSGVLIAFFDDDNWQTIVDSDYNCVTAMGATPAQGLFVRNGTMEITPNGFDHVFPIYEKEKPRFWYVAVAASDCSTDIEIDGYTLTFLNDGSQLGYDEIGVPTMYAVALGIWIVALVVAVREIFCHAPFAPRTLAGFFCALILQILASLFLLIHWQVYASDGNGSDFIEGVGRFCHVASQSLLWLVAAFIACGVTVSTYKWSDRTGNLCAFVLLLFVLAMYIMLAVWYEDDMDPSDTTYVYNTAVGYTLMAFHLLFGAWWAWRLWSSYRTETRSVKKSYYVKFFFGFAPAFLIVPVVVTLGALLAAPVRFRIVTAVDMALFMALNVATAWLLWPSARMEEFSVPEEGVLITADGLAEDGEGDYEDMDGETDPSFLAEQRLLMSSMGDGLDGGHDSEFGSLLGHGVAGGGGGGGGGGGRGKHPDDALL